MPIDENRSTGSKRTWSTATALLILLAAGCGKHPDAPEAPAESGGPPEGWREITPEPEQEAEATPPAEATDPMRALDASIETLRGSQELRHDDVVAALGHLADAVAALEGRADEAEVAELRIATGRLAATDTTSPDYTELGKEALLNAVQALTPKAGTEPMELPELAGARAAVGRIDDAQPLLQQMEPVADALQQLADLLGTLEERPEPVQN